MADTQTARTPALSEEATPSNLEVELKLAGSPETLADLDNAEPLRRRAIGRGVMRRMRYAYYDTAELDLRARGLSFRVRQEGRRYIQTLKSGDNVSGPMHRRGEWQVEVAGFEPHPEAFQDPAARAWLGSVRPEDLRRVFSAEVRRKKRVLNGRGNDGVIEVCFDEGEVATDQGTVPIAEIELELLRGSPDALYQLAMELHALSPLRVETQSKSARGYLLATGAPPTARKAEKLALPKTSRIEAAMAQTVRACIAHWTANEAAALDGRDPEGIHQMRVGLRRLRSALSLFRDVIPESQYTALQDEARWVVKGLGPARDWDVFLAETLPPVLVHRPEDADLHALRDAAEAKVAEGYEQARETICAPRYTAFLLTLGAWVEGRGWRVVTAPEEAPVTGSAEQLDRPVIEFADQLLTRRHRKVMRLGRGFARLAPEERHQVRIAVKKLRYATEFFRALYPKRKTKGYLDALERLQDALGVMNDITVADSLLQLIDDAAPARAEGLVLGWYDHKAAKAEPELRRDWRAFAKATPFWDHPRKEKLPPVETVQV